MCSLYEEQDIFFQRSWNVNVNTYMILTSIYCHFQLSEEYLVFSFLFLFLKETYSQATVSDN